MHCEKHVSMPHLPSGLTRLLVSLSQYKWALAGGGDLLTRGRVGTHALLAINIVFSAVLYCMYICKLMSKMLNNTARLNSLDRNCRVENFVSN